MVSGVNNIRAALILLALLAPLDPFDLEPGENSTFTVEYHITAEDHKSPYLVNDATA